MPGLLRDGSAPLAAARGPGPRGPCTCGGHARPKPDLPLSRMPASGGRRSRVSSSRIASAPPSANVVLRTTQREPFALGEFAQRRRSRALLVLEHFAHVGPDGASKRCVQRLLDGARFLGTLALSDDLLWIARASCSPARVRPRLTRVRDPGPVRPPAARTRLVKSPGMPEQNPISRQRVGKRSCR